ncbi:MAG: DoxX family protein [Cephaloticoccus sp.]|nr:DoxX family protein [Cephaloticoccus sp.]MCF7760452.1 DoxX family protein [Cephaloticoccus sp.]
MKTKIALILKTNAHNWGLLFPRLVLGLIMIAHGAQKLFGWFGGYGLEGTAGFFADKLGMTPGIFWAALAGGGEFLGGALLLLGLATRFGALLVGVTMLVAIITVHHGAFFNPAGMEFPLALLGLAIAFVINGGGALSIDSLLSHSYSANKQNL